MREIWKRFGQAMLVVLFAAGVAVGDTSNNMPPPGTLNYVEGRVSVQGQNQTQNSVGTTYLDANQVLDTGNGDAEILLTPGVYLRIGQNSEVRMISPGLADTRVQLTRGSAMLEVDELFKENDLSVVVGGSTTRLEKEGLYYFTATGSPSVKVLEGKAVIREGNQRLKLTKGHEALLAAGEPMDRRRYDKDQVENDPLYRWSKLRSDYATESNVDEADNLYMGGGWWGPGWYWDPFWSDFAFMPGFGIGWGAFGYPFFSPWCVGYAPYYGFGYGHWHGGYGHFLNPGGRGRGLPPLAHQPRVGSAGFHAFPRGMAAGRVGIARGGFRGGSVGGFRGGMRGGFRGGSMGGFHGGGFGGGFHGGGFGGGRR